MERIKEQIMRAHAGDKEARDALVSENLGLVHIVARRFENRGHDREELFQIGCIGLMKAIDRFDISLDLRFSTYAVPKIAGEIRRFLRDDGMVRVARSLKEKGLKVARAREKLEGKLSREPDINEVAEAAGLSPEEVVMAIEANGRVESLYKNDAEGDGEWTLIDKTNLYDGGCLNEADILIDKIAVDELMEQLSDTERHLITLRYFDGYTQRMAGERLGISQVQVSRLEKKILLSMRRAIT